MGTKTYRPRVDDRIPDAAEVLDGKIGQIIKYRLIPQIAVRNRIAVQGQQVPFYLFRKFRASRRCSCLTTSSSPDQQCLSCFNTGMVGGYEKYGTQLSVFDVTHPNSRSINLFPDYSGITQPPVKWKLIPGSTYGYVETKIELQQNLGLLDELFTDDRQTDGGDLRYLVRAPGDSSFVEVTEPEVKKRLGNPWLIWRVEIRRESLTAQSPSFGLIYLRYQTKKDMTVRCDIPKTKRTKIVDDSGQADEWQRQSFWLADKVRMLDPGDFLVSIDGVNRWRIYEAEETAPMDILTSWDVTTRLIQYWEPRSAVPLGNLSTKYVEELNNNDPVNQRKPTTVGY